MFRIITFISFCIIVTKSVLEYGEFDLKVTNYEACKAPRRKYCAEVKAYLFNDVWIKYDVLVKENMTSIKAIIVGRLNNKEIVRLRINNMCEHIFFKPMFLAIYNVTTGRCGLYEGRHKFSVDIQAISRTLSGGKYMYGNWTYKTLYFNDYCNVRCEILQTMVTPKKM